MYSRKPRHRKLAGVGPGKSCMHVAFGVGAGSYRDAIGMNLQHISDNLRGGRLVSLALRAGADRDHDLAVDIQLTVGALRIAGKWRAGIYDLRLAKIVGT